MNTKEIVQAANLLLASMHAYAKYTPTEVLDQLYLEADPAKIKAADALHKFVTKNANFIPPGIAPKAMEGSIVKICEKYLPGELPSVTAAAMAELKAAKRVTQIGGGKGKAIVILNPAPLPVPDVVKEDPLDSLQILKMLKDSLQADSADLKALKDQVETLTKTLAERDNSIEELSKQIHSHYQTTWS